MRHALCVLAVAAAASPARADTEWIAVDRIAVVVSSDVILASDVERELGTMPDVVAATDVAARARKRAELRPKAIDALIEGALWRQQADKSRVEVDPADVDQAIAEIEKQNQITHQQLEDALVAQGYTMATYRVALADQIKRLRLVNMTIRPSITVDDAEVRAEYERLKGGSGAGVQPFDDVKDDLRTKLYTEKQDAAIKRALTAWRANTYVDVRLP